VRSRLSSQWSAVIRANLFRGGRFVAVGWMGTGMNTLCLYVLKGRLHVPIIPASLLATEAALIHNFIWLRYWVWGDRSTSGRPPFWRQLAVYNLATGAADLLVSIPLLWLLYKVAGVPYLLANLAGMIVGPFLKFGLNDKLIFKEERNASTQRLSPAPCQSDLTRAA
jgi:dolichol-phosphate mannosyltransferase